MSRGRSVRVLRSLVYTTAGENEWGQECLGT